MTSFGFDSTADDMLAGVDITGLNVLIGDALDPGTAAALWTRSEALVDETFQP